MCCPTVGCGTASQRKLGFQSALIVERLRGQGYGDFPGAVSTFFSTAHFNNRLPDTEECSQSLPKNFKSESSTLSTQKTLSNAAMMCRMRPHTPVIRFYDGAGLAWLGCIGVALSQFEHNLFGPTMNYYKAKLSCEINAAGATFSGVGTAVRVAA